MPLVLYSIWQVFVLHEVRHRMSILNGERASERVTCFALRITPAKTPVSGASISVARCEYNAILELASLQVRCWMKR